MFRRRLWLCTLALLAACAQPGTTPPKSGGGFSPSQLAKSDVDRVAEAHQREVFNNLKLLAEKLYRRNPRELKKSGAASVDAGLARIFEGRHEWKFPELQGKRGTDAIYLTFRDDYAGDRVLATISSLLSVPSITRRTSSCDSASAVSR